MIAFRKPKKKKDGLKLRKKKVKVLKADDLLPDSVPEEDAAKRFVINH